MGKKKKEDDEKMRDLSLPELPESILFLFQEYLSFQDYRNIFNTCNSSYLQFVKKKSCIYPLTIEASKDYFHNKLFKQRILSLIEDTSKQLGVHISGNKFSFSNFTIFTGIKFVKLENLNKASIIDLSIFHVAEVLEIYPTQNLLNFDSLKSIIKLSISNCKKLTDISGLACCHSLRNVSFQDCPLLSDVNSISHANIVSLSSCPITNKGIASFSHGNIQYLNMKQIEYINSIEHISSLTELHLSSCFNIQRICGLLQLKSLHLFSCIKINSYVNLPSLQRLVVTDASIKLNEVNSHAIKEMKLRSVYLNGAESLVHFMNLEHLELSSVGFSSLFPEGFDVNSLATSPCLRKLSLSSVRNIFNIHLFQGLISLRLVFCRLFRGFDEPMPNLRVIQVYRCDSFNSFVGLYQTSVTNMCISIESCPSFIPDISFYLFVMKHVGKLEMTDNQSNQPMTKGNVPPKVIIPKDVNIARNKTIFIKEIPLYLGLAVKYLFSTIQYLMLYRLKFPHLSSCYKIDLHTIPMLHLKQCENLLFLYPREKDWIPQHKWVIFESCGALKDISGVQSVPRVSIFDCPNLFDFTSFLQGSSKRLDYGRCGLSDLSSRIGPMFEEIKEKMMIYAFDPYWFRIDEFNQDQL